MEIRILLNEHNTPIGKLADAELHFDDHDGVLDGLKLQGFGIWESRWPARGGGLNLNVTFPARSYLRDGEQRNWTLLRDERGSAERLKLAILEAYAHAVRTPGWASVGTSIPDAPRPRQQPQRPQAQPAARPRQQPARQPQPAARNFRQPAPAPAPPAQRTGTDDDYPF